MLSADGKTDGVGLNTLICQFFFGKLAVSSGCGMNDKALYIRNIGEQREDFKAYGQDVLKVFEERAKEQGITVAPNSYEGVRLAFASEEVKGWALLRLSLHDPLMPLNLEGEREGDCDKMVEIVRGLLTGFDQLAVI